MKVAALPRWALIARWNVRRLLRRLEATPETGWVMQDAFRRNDIRMCRAKLGLPLEKPCAELAGGIKCPVHLVPEPCPTCTAYINAGL